MQTGRIFRSLWRFKNTNILTTDGQEALQNIKGELASLGDNNIAMALVELIDLVSKNSLTQLFMSTHKLLKLMSVIDGGTGGCFIPVMDDTTRKIAEIVLKYSACFRVKNDDGCLLGINNEILKSTASFTQLDFNDFGIALLENYKAEVIVYDAGSTKADAIARKLHAQDLRRIQNPEAYATRFLAETSDLSCLSVTYLPDSSRPIKNRGKASVFVNAMESECQAISKGLINPTDNFVMQAVSKLLNPDAIKKYNLETTVMINKLISELEEYQPGTGEKKLRTENLLFEIKTINTNDNDDAFAKLNKLESCLSDHLPEMTFGRLYNLALDARAKCILEMQKQEPGCDAWLAKKVAELQVKYQELAANPVENRDMASMKTLKTSASSIPRKKL